MSDVTVRWVAPWLVDGAESPSDWMMLQSRVLTSAWVCSMPGSLENEVHVGIFCSEVNHYVLLSKNCCKLFNTRFQQDCTQASHIRWKHDIFLPLAPKYLKTLSVFNCIQWDNKINFWKKKWCQPVVADWDIWLLSHFINVCLGFSFKLSTGFIIDKSASFYAHISKEYGLCVILRLLKCIW